VVPAFAARILVPRSRTKQSDGKASNERLDVPAQGVAFLEADRHQ
jgi:hypothetical protein